MKTYHSNVTGCFIWNLHETLQIRTNGALWIRTTETTWWRTTETLLVAWFETCLTRRGDVLIGCCCYFLLRCHHDVECFIQDIPATSLGHTEGHSYDVAMTSCGRVDLHIKMFVYMFWYIFMTLFFEVLPKLTKRLHFWVASCKFCWFIPEIWCKQRLLSKAQCQES